MFSAPMLATAVSFFVRVVAACRIWVVLKFSLQERSYLCIGIARSTRIKLNASLSQCISGTAADSAANQY